MNSKPWPPYPMAAPASTGEDGIRSALNELIRQYNEITKLVGGLADQIVWLLEHVGNVEGGSLVKRYDGITPEHDDIPWVITNGVLREWPLPDSFTVGKIGTDQLQVDRITGKLRIYKQIVPFADGTTGIQIADASGTYVMNFDTVNMICYPKRIVIPNA